MVKGKLTCFDIFTGLIVIQHLEDIGSSYANIGSDLEMLLTILKLLPVAPRVLAVWTPIANIEEIKL